MTHVKLSKTNFFRINTLRNKQKLQLIWTYENMVNFNHSKDPNYLMVKVLKENIFHMNLSSFITLYIEFQ
jgi:general stress protein 26